MPWNVEKVVIFMAARIQVDQASSVPTTIPPLDTISCEPEMDVKWLNDCLTVSVTGVGFGLVLLKGF